MPVAAAVVRCARKRADCFFEAQGGFAARVVVGVAVVARDDAAVAPGIAAGW